MADQSKKNLNNICCEVENCIHNDHKCGCSANEVKVGPHFATTCNDTVCQTYKKQSIK